MWQRAIGGRPTIARLACEPMGLMPFACADGTCMFCDNGLQVSHIYGSFFGMGGEAGRALAKAVRILQADSDL